MGRREAPVPDGPLKNFASGLRDLRVQVPGSPTYRELAGKAHYSASVLSVAAAGHRLPTWDVTLAFVTACDGDVDEWRERWSDLRAAHPELTTEAEAPKATDVLNDADLATPPAPPGPPAEGDLPASVLPLTRSDPATVGQFRLLGRLGGGAMGQVYLGASKTGRPVAVKVVRPHLAEDSHFRRRFAAEIAAVRRVDSPYTPTVIAADSEAERPWMVTAYISGPSLGDVVEAGGALSAEVVFRLAAGIAEALADIHAAGVLHRDVKPSNVLLEVTGPKVIDFGVAQADDGTRMTQTGMRVGTVPFMAPEQADGCPVTPASDVFSLGAVLAYACTGVPPFGDGTTGEVLYRLIHTDPDPAALDCGDDRLRDLIVSCLDKDPERRPTPAQVIDVCAGHRLRVYWLPKSVGAWAERSADEISTLFATAAGRHKVVRFRRRAAVVGAMAVVVAVAISVVNPFDTSGRARDVTSRGKAPSAVSKAWTATSGPSCSTGRAVETDTSGSWTPLASSATGDCGNALIHRTTDSGDGANWVFYPGVGKTCTFHVGIPNSNVVTASNVTYQAWDTLPGKHTDGHRIGGDVRADQEANRGKAIAITLGPTDNGTIDFQIYDAYAEHKIEAADVVTAVCS